MEFDRGLQRIGHLDVHATRRRAEEADCTVFVLPGKDIADRASFFDAVRGTFPLDPPIVGHRVWDALLDSLREGLYTHPARRFAILWPNAQVMARSAQEDFETALDVLAYVATDLADPRATVGNPKQVAVLVEDRDAS
jgi:hypothetical protein